MGFMFRNVLRFYWMCARRACSGKFWKAEKWTGGIGLLATAVIYFIEPSETGEQMIGVEVPLIFFASAFILVVGLGFIAAPYQFFKEEKDRADMLDERQQPKLRVSTRAQLLRSVKYGGTIQTHGGIRHTQIHDFKKVAVVYVTNDGRSKLEHVTCRLMAAWFNDGDRWGKLPIMGSIELSFESNIETPVLAIDIEPNDTVCVYLALITPVGRAYIYRKIPDLPFDYQTLFGNPGRYQILIQFRSALPDPLQALVDLNVKVAPRVEGKVPQGEADVVILKQGAPPQWPEGIEEETPH